MTFKITYHNGCQLKNILVENIISWYDIINYISPDGYSNNNFIKIEQIPED